MELDGVGRQAAQEILKRSNRTPRCSPLGIREMNALPKTGSLPERSCVRGRGLEPGGRGGDFDFDARSPCSNCSGGLGSP